MKLAIVYNLTVNETLGCYLPAAYLCDTDRSDGSLRYIKAKALPDTIASYSVAWEATPHVSLFTLIDELSEAKLCSYTTKSGRRQKSLAQICEDRDLKGHLLKYVDRKMTALLAGLREHKYPLCLGAKKKEILEQYRVHYRQKLIQPLLHFAKTESGITYSLSLNTGDRIVRCSRHDLHLCVRRPAQIILDQELCHVATIDTNKIKPFLSQDEINIPKSKVGVYFEKFILPMVQKVDISTSGFEVQKDSTLTKVSIKMVHDFINSQYTIDLIFHYGDTQFSYGAATRSRTKLTVSPSGSIDIQQVQRCQTEEHYASLLKAKGLHSTPSKTWTTTSQTKYAVVDWLISHRSYLHKEGIYTNHVAVADYEVVLEPASEAITASQQNDWFDLKGIIQVGGYEIPFGDFVQNIANEDPLYKLPDGKVWIIPAAWMSKYSTLPKYAQFKNGEVTVNKANKALLGEITAETFPMPASQELSPFTYVASPQLKATLRPYQRAGVEWLLQHQASALGACLADDMGLGKTLQTLAVLNYTKEQIKSNVPKHQPQQQLDLFSTANDVVKSPLRSLVILPASLVFNWRREIQKFTPHLLVSQYVGASRSEKAAFLHQYDIVLTTYQTALRDIELLQGIEWRYVILDESQVIKNKNSKVFQAITSLSAEHRISLSGTPVENSLSDLWSQMQFINPDMLGSYEHFQRSFQKPIEKYQDEAAMDILRQMVQPYILRRRKEEVATDLPPLHRQTEYIPMVDAQQNIYDEEKSAARNHLLHIDGNDSNYQAHVFASLLRLRQIANHPILADSSYTGKSGKLQRVQEQLQKVYAAGNKVLVFSAFKSHLQLIAQCLEKQGHKYCLLTGDTAQQQREKQVQLFETSADHNAFLISLKAGGVGLNLTQASYVFILDPWWNPAAEEQAIARAHRIGQEQPVTVMKFISTGSLEEKIIKLQAQKSVLAAEVIESEEVFHMTKEVLMDLLN